MAQGQIFRVNSSNHPAWSTATFPDTAGTNGNILTSDGTNWTSATPATSGTVTSVSGTANQVSVATGTTTPVISLIGPYTPATYTAHGVLVGEGTSSIVALAAGSAGQVLQSEGAAADPIYSTATYPSTAGTAGKILISNGTNIVSSTPTYPNASATSGKIITSDGTNFIASAYTVASPGTSGNILTSDGTNWTSGAPASTSMTWTSTSGTFTAVKNNGYFLTTTSTPTMPASPSIGDTISFYVDAAATITITGNTGQFIRISGLKSASAGTCVSSTQGDTITLVYNSTGTVWNATSSIGSWVIT